MSEAQLQDAVIEMAQLLGWRVAHFRPAQTTKGWATPVQADGAGFPDLIMLRDSWMIAAELKSAKGKVSPAQDEWLDAFLRVGATVAVWYPRDLRSGEIERALRAGDPLRCIRCQVYVQPDAAARMLEPFGAAMVCRNAARCADRKALLGLAS